MIDALRSLRSLLLSALGVLALLLLASLVRGVPFGMLSRDVASIGQVIPLTGALSNCGVLFWCISCVVTAFAAAALRGSTVRSEQRFLISSSIFSGLLLVDDLFLLHEDLAYRYFGIRERYVMLGWGVLLGTHLLLHARVILRTRYTVLMAALALFAGSVMSDALLAQWKLITITDGSLLVLVEDGIKWVGIVTWCAYHVWTASSFLASAEERSKPDAAHSERVIGRT